MTEWLKDFFYYTPTERRGYVAMLSIILIGRGLPALYPYFYKPFEQDKLDLVQASKNAAEYKALFKKTERTESAHNVEDDEKEFRAYRPFPFNPNTATKEDFVRLGLMEKTANTIVHYREKGGKFYKSEDFKRIWGLANSDYERLKEYMNFETLAYRKKKDNKGNEVEEVIPEYFNFNPNSAPIDDLLRLGIPKRTAYILINFREKGAFFKKKEDLKKIYGMTDSIYAALAPFIVLDGSKPVTAGGATVTSNVASATENTATIVSPTSVVATNTSGNIPTNLPNAYTTTSSKRFPAAAIPTIDVNKATEEDWVKLPGIGNGYARKILNFRTKLGGFYSIEQIKETYGLPDSTFQKAKNYLVLSPISKKININSVTVEELKTHPCFRWQYVNIITNYRAQHDGKIANLEELKKIQGIPPDVLEKMKPYLEF